MSSTQPNHTQNEMNIDPSIGSSQRNNPSSPTNGSNGSFLNEQSGLNNNLSNEDNSNIVINPNVGVEATFPSHMQIADEMDYSMIVDTSSLPTSDIHAEANSDTESLENYLYCMRKEIEFRHAILEHLRAGGSLEVDEELEDVGEPIEGENVVQEGQEEEEEEDNNVGMWLTHEEIMTAIRHETIEFVAEDAAEKEVCEICQDAYVKGDKVGRLDCSHKFHLACIKPWLMLKNICPKCRRMALLPIYVDYTP